MELTLARAKENYLAALTLEGKSPETVLWHNKKLSAFVSFMCPTGSEVKICDLTVEDARRFVKALMERKTKYPNHVFHQEVPGGLAPQTIYGFVRSLKAFASWLQEEGYTEDHLFERLQPPKVPQILIEPLTEDEIRRLLAAIPQDTLEGARNYTIILLFPDTGMRLSELVNLELDQIDLVAGEMKVFGKGAKERIVPLGLNTRRALLRYKEHARPQPTNPNEQRLFLNVAGEPITKDGVEKLMQRLARRANIPRLHPHLLRHTFAVRYFSGLVEEKAALLEPGMILVKKATDIIAVLTLTSCLKFVSGEGQRSLLLTLRRFIHKSCLTMPDRIGMVKKKAQRLKV